MELLRTLTERGVARGIDFIVVGGHALSGYGITRQTGDVDLIVCDDDREAWKAILTELGYELFHDHEAFLQFAAPALEAWPVDLISVDSRTFDELRNDSRCIELGDVRVTIPSPRHLIALKLHALRQGQASRELKDLDDVVRLIELADLDPEGEELRLLCQRYASEDIHERIVTILRRRRDE